jgi:hypothetical protein
VKTKYTKSQEQTTKKICGTVLSKLADECFALNVLDAHRQPLVGRMLLSDEQFLVVVCEGFSKTSDRRFVAILLANVFARRSECDRFNSLSHKSLHEQLLFLASKVAQKFAPLSGYVDRNLISH